MNSDESNSPRNPIQSESNSKSESESKPAQAREEDFEIFWKAYPRSEGKQKAKSAFSKVDVPLDVLLNALEEQKRSAQWGKNNGQFIPHASTWLNGKRWEDKMVTNYDDIPKGASGVLGEAELYAIRRALADDTPPLPYSYIDEV